MLKLDKNEVIKAIVSCNGIIENIRKTLKVKSWNTVYDYIQKEGLQELLEASMKPVTDKAKSNVIEEIMGGDIELSKWWLARMDREKFGDNYKVNVKLDIDLDKLTTEQLKRIAAGESVDKVMSGE